MPLAAESLVLEPQQTPQMPAVAIRRASTESNNVQARTLFSRFAKLDPELYGILAVTVGAVSAFAYYFELPSFKRKCRLIVNLLAGNPTGTSDSRNVPAVPGSEPWRKEGATASGKYMYYPGGDVHSKPKEAPSALNVAVIPKVNLPKVGE
ncbi:hypothetical protein SLS58_010801 [Diplodia intermedia]|uniref:Uncharacterized protein n=1 Tax=Diplodia intermedia TaxID=856260 RepID=A0ABR3T3H2_9PEZI